MDSVSYAEGVEPKKSEQKYEPEQKYEMVNHPSHYNIYDIEVLDMMKKIWNIFSAAMWCKLTAFKYRMRMGSKPGNSMQQEISKETFLLDRYKIYKEEISALRSARKQNMHKEMQKMPDNLANAFLMGVKWADTNPVYTDVIPLNDNEELY